MFHSLQTKLKPFILIYLRPNYLSSLRLILAGFIPIFYISEPVYTFYVFIFASITDILDGYIARKYNITSAFGGLFDSFADKVLLISTGLCLLTTHHNTQLLIIMHLMFFRELCVFMLRLYANTIHLHLHVSMLSKIKTVIQAIVFSIMLHPQINAYYMQISQYYIAHSSFESILYIPLLLSIISGIEYLVLILNKIFFSK